MLFLIDYDRRAGKVVTVRKFDPALRAAAMAARFDLELAHSRASMDREVVLLEAADEDAIRKTHGRYFADVAELARLPERENGATE